ncbi:hypothetical protein ABK905_00445 [Acerihabitans sp. KWT182]|uniref:Uncharacterized protein n=1 Tax=Acerihabitans sp. KWT182 TaxID=3157919 RepID=A0AAU7Q9Z4_9GAMM
MDNNNETLDAYITDGFERAEKRTNMTWFYPKICNFQDDFPSFEAKENYLDFLDTPPDAADLSSILLYIHIPFCLSFCNFCACYKELSYKWKGEKRTRFVSALIKQIAYFSQKTYFRSKSISHIQFGGG